MIYLQIQITILNFGVMTKDEEFEYICKEIENGMPARKAIKSFMSTSTFYELMEKHEHLAKRYARAKSDAIEAKFESIQNDYEEEPQRDHKFGTIDASWVQLQRLKIDSKKWELSKLLPKKYGDKIDVEHSGEVTQNIINLGDGINPNEATD